MKQRSFFVICLIFVIAGCAAAQVKSLTNSDLEKYRVERLKAERDLRENYAELGFSSPEERERRLEQSRAESERLFERLRAEQLEREALEVQRRSANAQNAYYSQDTRYISEAQNSQPYGFFSYGSQYRLPGRRYPHHHPGQSTGGHFLSVWPTSGRVRHLLPPRPNWIRRR